MHSVTNLRMRPPGLNVQFVPVWQHFVPEINTFCPFRAIIAAGTVKKMNEEIKSRPKYGMLSNVRFMAALAMRECPSVLLLAALEALLALGDRLIRLFMTPVILSHVESGAAPHTLIASVLLFTLGLMLSGALIGYVSANTLFGRVQVRSSLVRALHMKASRTSYPNTGDQTFLKRLNKAQGSVGSNSQATEAVWGTLRDLTRSILGFGAYLALLSSLNPLVALVTIVTSSIDYLAGRPLNSWSYRHREEEGRYWQKTNYVVRQASNAQFAKDIRIFGMKDWLEAVFGSTLAAFQAFKDRKEKLRMLTGLVSALLALLRNGAAYALLIGVALRNGLSASEFLLYFTAVGGFTEWVTGILAGLSTLREQSADISNVRETLEYPEPFQLDGGAELRPDPNASFELRLDDVSFRYPGAERDTLSHVSLAIRPGEKLAVVGLNGAGKTTLVKLLCGLLDPTDGCVLLNGRDIRQFNRRDYYRLFSAVFQQFSLLAASVAENIAQTTDGNADRERVRRCADLAGLTEKIESLPQGFDTMLGKEVYEDAPELSGGETQRLMLARALYKNAPVILLDEPTAALDPLAESDLYRKYSELTCGRTSVYISHRLASTRFCDRVLLIENGGIAEEGTHDQLMALGGRYADLFAIQSRYYAKGDCEHEEN